jgi:hypothetical protein
MVNTNSLKNLKPDAFKGGHHTQEWKDKHRQRMTGKKNPFYGKKHSKEIIEKMRKAKIGLVGEKSNHWKGGITELRKKIKQYFKYRQWRTDVFTRDNWTCQDCNRKVRKIEADHDPIEFAKILREYNIKTMEDALECEKLWDINNGKTRCFDCHETRHKCLKNLKNRRPSKD